MMNKDKYGSYISIESETIMKAVLGMNYMEVAAYKLSLYYILINKNPTFIMHIVICYEHKIK
jgi:hypothetical protein